MNTEAWSRLLDEAEDALAAGLTEAEAHSAVAAAASSLEADRMTAEDLGQPDPYPHLALSDDPG